MQDKHIINTHKDLMDGISRLLAIEPAFARIVDAIDPNDDKILPLRRWQSDFASIARIIIAQQVSIASAAAITTRLVERCSPLSAQAFLAGGEELWRHAGLSRAKQTSLAAIAEMVIAGKLDLAALALLPMDEARKRLLQIKGIGPWTVEIYLLSCTGYSDAFPAGDIALQEAAYELFSLSSRPSSQELEQLAQNWSPLRAVAARLLWAHYRVLKRNREGGLV